MSNEIRTCRWCGKQYNALRARERGIIGWTDYCSERCRIAAKNAKGQQSGGCYVATAVYGSYNCPQVWTLRRFRDNTLGETWYGRAFINTYYAVNPTLVKWFGDTEWFKKMWRKPLDRMVDSLQKKGVEATPYQDKY